jgi:hypothetical protein
MNFKDILDEVRDRGEKLKGEILDELIKSKTLNQIVSNKNFINAVSRVIETKDEVKRAIQGQVKSLFQVMDVPNKHELFKIGGKISELEKLIARLGIQGISLRGNGKSNGHRTTRRSAPSGKTKSAAAKSSARKATKTKKTTRRAGAKRKSSRK